MRATRRATSTGPVMVACAMVLAGCASGTTDEATATHTMLDGPDGTVMDGSVHVHDDSHQHGGGERTPAQAGPSEAARMVCTGQVVSDVTRILDLDSVARPSSAWEPPMFTCTFDLPAGPLVLSVHDAHQEDAGRAHFRRLRAELVDTEPLEGIYSLGLPAYETDDGTVAFIRDGKTLRVDATGLTGSLGVGGDFTRTEVAYAVATSVLACWTEHA